MAVEVVVDVLVDLLLLAVLAEQAAEHTLAAHPQDLRWHPGLAGAPALADALMAALALGVQVLAHAGAGVHLHRFPDDEAVLDQLPDVEARVRHRDLIGLVGVEPDP